MFRATRALRRAAASTLSCKPELAELRGRLILFPIANESTQMKEEKRNNPKKTLQRVSVFHFLMFRPERQVGHMGF